MAAPTSLSLADQQLAAVSAPESTVATLLDQQASASSGAKILTKTVGNPAAGADWSLVVPAGKTWQLLSVTAFFQASAVVANRFPFLNISNIGAVKIIQIGPGNSVATSVGTTQQWIAGWSGAETSVLGVINRYLPSGLVLPSGYTISTTTVSKDVGDQWSAISISVVEITNGP